MDSESNLQRPLLFQAKVTFEDVAVFLSQDEWDRLGPAQRGLYRHVMMETYGNVVSVGKAPCRLWVGRGEGACGYCTDERTSLPMSRNSRIQARGDLPAGARRGAMGPGQAGQ